MRSYSFSRRTVWRSGGGSCLYSHGSWAVWGVGPLLAAGRRAFETKASGLRFFQRHLLGVGGKTLVFYAHKRTVVAVSLEGCRVMPGARVALLPDSVVSLADTDGSFLISFFTCSRAVFGATYFHLRPPFVRFVGRGTYCARARSRPIHTVAKLVATDGTVCHSSRGLCHRTVTRGLLRVFFLSACSGIRHCFARRRVGNDGQGRRLFGGFVGLMRACYTARQSIIFCTSRLYVSAHCLSTVAGRITRGSTGRVVSRGLVLRLGVTLRSANVSLGRVTSGCHFPSRSFFKQCFGGRAKVSPGRCETGGG